MTATWDGDAWFGAPVDAALSVQRPDLDVVYCHGPAFDATRLLAEDYVGGPVAVRGRAMPYLAPFLAGPAYRLLLHALLHGLAIGRIDADWPQAAPCAVLPELLPLLPRLQPGFQARPGRAAGTAELWLPEPASADVTVLHDGPAPDLAETDWPSGRLAILPAAGQAWRHAATEHLVILAAGATPAGPGWLQALTAFCHDDATGLVGATPGAHVQHETLAVPFHAIAMRRSTLADAGGLDPGLCPAAAVADLCLRLRRLGLRVIGTPYTAIQPAAPVTLPPEDLARLRLTWPALLAPDIAEGLLSFALPAV